MKTIAIAGMAIVGMDCAEKALGWQSQSVFTADYLWIWWIIAATWFINAIIMCFAQVKLL